MAEVNLRVGTDFESGEVAYIRATGSRAVFICGKRGSGKSYTLGVIIEELFAQERGKSVLLIADPMGIYHTMALANEVQQDEVRQAGLLTEGFPVRLIVPGDPLTCYGDAQVVNRLQTNGVEVTSLWINAHDLSADAWCELFNFEINNTMGIAMWRAVDALHEIGEPFTIADITEHLQKDERAKGVTVEALENRLAAAGKWGIFSEEPTRLTDVFSLDHINILDLSVIDAGTKGLRNLVLDVVARRLFTERTRMRRREEFGMETHLPRVWMAIDEAHQFVPQGKVILV